MPDTTSPSVVPDTEAGHAYRSPKLRKLSPTARSRLVRRVQTAARDGLTRAMMRQRFGLAPTALAEILGPPIPTACDWQPIPDAPVEWYRCARTGVLARKTLRSDSPEAVKCNVVTETGVWPAHETLCGRPAVTADYGRGRSSVRRCRQHGEQ